MARGNQRELARAKNAKKQQQEKKKSTGDPTKRMESDAEIMRQKQQAGKYNYLCITSEVSNWFLYTAMEKKASEGKK